MTEMAAKKTENKAEETENKAEETAPVEEKPVFFADQVPSEVANPSVYPASE